MNSFYWAGIGAVIVCIAMIALAITKAKTGFGHDAVTGIAVVSAIATAALVALGAKHAKNAAEDRYELRSLLGNVH